MEEKQIIGEIICPACGKPTKVKVNKNGSLFVYCTNEIDEESGEKCYHRITWGRRESRRFIKHNELEVLKYGAVGTTDIRTNRHPDKSGDDGFARVWGL